MKHNRHIKILSIIQEKEIHTQEELAEALINEGYNVTQATVSRDIKDLKLIKVTNKEGKASYISSRNNKEVISERLITVLRQSYISSDTASNLLIVKTLPGMAQAAASAVDAYDSQCILFCFKSYKNGIISCNCTHQIREIISINS